MPYSENEQIEPATRHLGFGNEPGILATASTVDEAVLMALEVSTATPEPADLVVRKDPDNARAPAQRSGESALRGQLAAKSGKQMEDNFYVDRIAGLG